MGMRDVLAVPAVARAPSLPGGAPVTEVERRDFCNLLARGRGLAPVYDADAMHTAAVLDAALNNNARPVDAGRALTALKEGQHHETSPTVYA